jgi:kexin
MRVHWLAAAAAIAHGASSVTAKSARRDHTTHAYYALEHAPHAGAALSECAAALGVELVERVGELSNVWLVRAPHAALAARSASAGADADPVVAALAELRARAAQQPSWLALPHPRRRAQHARRVAASVRFLERQVPRQRVKRDGRAVLDAPTDGGPLATTHDVATTLGIADPEFPKQWHLVNDEFPEHAMNVSRLWAEGVTGKGIISALVDDGLDFTSDDLAPNFVRGCV